MTEANESRETGRRAFAARRWQQAYDDLSAASEALDPEDIESLASAAYLLGEEEAAAAAWASAHDRFSGAGRARRAARCGFWLSLTSLLAGDTAQGAGWLARTRRGLKEHPDCPESGLALVVEGLLAMGQDPDEAGTAVAGALELAERHDDPDLLAFALLGRGQVLIQTGCAAEGVPHLDEAMVTVVGGKVSPIAAGIVYCAVILTCRRILDLQRSREWTQALDAWCASQPDLVAFQGACLVHRSEILQLRGEWSAASSEAQRACDWYEERGLTPAGRAFYQRAELHRLHGELEAAEALYRVAGEYGFEPQPGLSLLRLAEGRLEPAAAAIRRVVDESGNRGGPGGGPGRTQALGPYVQIMLACDDVEAARRGADELARLAAETDLPLVAATAAEAAGAVALADGDPHAALASLRRAWTAWQTLEAAFESARVQALIGQACGRLGDADTAARHLDAARAVFERLGAEPALQGLQADEESRDPGALARLSRREREVLALVASGGTNRQIAAELCISEHTVARHLSNLFNKLGVSSRTAAAALALKLGMEPGGQS